MEKKSNFRLLLIVVLVVLFFLGLFPLYVIGLRAKKTGENLSRIVAERFASYIDSLPYYSIQLLNDRDNNDLNDTITPDHSKVIELGAHSFNVFWNIADDVPAKSMRSVKIIVTPVGYSVKETITVVRIKPEE